MLSLTRIKAQHPGGYKLRASGWEPDQPSGQDGDPGATWWNWPSSIASQALLRGPLSLMALGPAPREQLVKVLGRGAEVCLFRSIAPLRPPGD